MPDSVHSKATDQIATPVLKEELGVATYDLDLIKKLLQSPSTRIITGEATRNASSLGHLNPDDIIKSPCGLLHQISTRLCQLIKSQA
jgi:hypothetical protein